MFLAVCSVWSVEQEMRTVDTWPNASDCRAVVTATVRNVFPWIVGKHIRRIAGLYKSRCSVSGLQAR